MSSDLSDVVKEGHVPAILDALRKLEIFDDKLLHSLLANSPTSEVADVLKSEYFKRIGKKKEECAKEADISEEENIEELTEEDAIKKYTTETPKINKAALMFLAGFKAVILNIKYDKAVDLSFEIAKYIYLNKGDLFPKIVRSKVHNLKENRKLCRDIYDAQISAAKFVEMSADEMKSEELKTIDDISIKDGILASQMAQKAAETELFKCSRCKEKKCTYSQLQTRSCDEPMTTFVYCTVCGHCWRF